MRIAEITWNRAAILFLLIAVLIPAIALPASAQYAIIARESVAIQINEEHPGGSCWYFPDRGTGTLYDIPALTIDNQTFCRLEPEQTETLAPGAYTLLYEEPVLANGKYFKDISWVNGSLISAFSEVDSIDESGNDGPMVLRDLEELITSNGFNSFSESQIVIKEPSLEITDIGQISEITFTIAGTSNLANETPVIIKIDEDRYFAQHNDSFTYQTQVIKPLYDENGHWTLSLLMPIQAMPAGWHTITAYAGDLTATRRFKVDQRDWEPAPTPTVHVKYLSNGDIAPVYVTVEKTIIQTEYVDRWHEATPTPDITDALGEKVNYPYSPGEKIPGWVGIGGLVAIAGIVLFSGWKRK
jgi:hypothetical protein